MRSGKVGKWVIKIDQIGPADKVVYLPTMIHHDEVLIDNGLLIWRTFENEAK